MVIIGRELVISALREWMSERGYRETVAVSMLGKVKTWVQMIAVALLLLATPQYPLFYQLGLVGIYGAAFLALWSMLLYLKQSWPQLQGQADQP
jgi:CDP-diacylglycerol--glycerol-3-phosphate 3-phosphatidyltransferase